MSSPTEKSQSESDLTTPTNYITTRIKRKREDDFGQFKVDFTHTISKLSAMIASQTTEIKNNSEVLKEIKQTNRNIEEAVSFLSAQHDEFKNKIETLEAQSEVDRKYIAALESKIEDLQRENRKNNLVIKNVPTQKNESKATLVNMVTELGNTVSCPIQKTEIKDVYRIHNKKENSKTSTVIVETTSTLLRNDVLKMCKAYNVRNRGNLSAKHIGLQNNAETPIYVSEQLTPRASKLYYLAREFKKLHRYVHCWTSYGKVYLRKEDNSQVILVSSEAQLDRLAKGK